MTVYNAYIDCVLISVFLSCWDEFKKRLSWLFSRQEVKNSRSKISSSKDQDSYENPDEYRYIVSLSWCTVTNILRL